MVIETKEDVYQTTPAELEPQQLSEFLPGWNFEEKLFSKSIRRGRVVREYWGWIFNSPRDALTMIIQKDQVLQFLRPSIYIKGIETIIAQKFDRTNLIEFTGSKVSCSLQLDLERETYKISYRQFLSRKRWTHADWEIDTKPTLLVVEGNNLRVTRVGDVNDYLNKS